MRTIILSALLGLGIGLAGIPAASAAPMSGLSSVAVEGSMIQDAQYYYRRPYYRPRPRVVCRTIRVCRTGYYGRRCHNERVCRRAW